MAEAVITGVRHGARMESRSGLLKTSICEEGLNSNNRARGALVITVVIQPTSLLCRRCLQRPARVEGIALITGHERNRRVRVEDLHPNVKPRRLRVGNWLCRTVVIVWTLLILAMESYLFFFFFAFHPF